MPILQELSADEIFRLLGGKNQPKRASGYMINCPTHKDSSPSLHIWEKNNRSYIHCHGGCDFKTLIAAIENAADKKYSAPERIKRAKDKKSRPAPAPEPQPIPIHPPPRPITHEEAIHPSLGNPALLHEYKDERGRTKGYVARFIQQGGRKIFLPVQYCANPDGTEGWSFKIGFAPPRPLYHLDKLTDAQPTTPVLINEGEKKADAAQELFPNWISTATMNGANSAHLTDYSVLKGRTLIISMDDDMNGVQYAADVAFFARKAGVAQIYLLAWPHHLRPIGDRFMTNPMQPFDGTDLYDAKDAGWQHSHIKTLWDKGWRPLIKLLTPR